MRSIRVNVRVDDKRIKQLLNSACQADKSIHEVKQCLDESIAELSKHGAGALDIDTAYKIITYLYTQFAKPRETLDSYRILANFGMYISRLIEASSSSHSHNDEAKSKNTSSKIFFIIDTDAWLGHIQILSSFLQKTDQSSRDSFEVIAFNGKQESIIAKKLASMSIPYTMLGESKISSKLKSLQQYIRKKNEQGYTCKLIWTGWPPMMFLGGCMRLSPKQCIWAMKYPYPLSHLIDEVYFAYGFHPSLEGKFYIHNSFQPIYSHPFYLTGDALSTKESNYGIDANTLQSLSALKRKRLSGIPVIMSAARPEKMCNPIFFKRLQNLLETNQGFCFAWCGREGDASTKKFKSFLDSQGLTDRSLFMGWVHTWDVIRETSYFLDTYPFGSGVTLAQAMRQRKRIVLHQSETPRQEPFENIDQFVINEPNYSAIIQSTMGYPSHLITTIKRDESTCYLDKNINANVMPSIQDRDLFAPTSIIHSKLTNLIFS